MTATALRATGLGVALALTTSLAVAQPSSAPPPAGTMQGPTIQGPSVQGPLMQSPMTMQPGSQPMTNSAVTSQGNPAQRACRQKWQQVKASGQKNGQTREQFLTNCMQGH